MDIIHFINKKNAAYTAAKKITNAAFGH